MFKITKSIIKMFIIVCIIILLLGYPLATFHINPFVFYWDKLLNIWNGCVIS